MHFSTNLTRAQLYNDAMDWGSRGPCCHDQFSIKSSRQEPLPSGEAIEAQSLLRETRRHSGGTLPIFSCLRGCHVTNCAATWKPHSIPRERLATRHLV